MTSSKREKAVENEIKAWVRAQGGWCTKLHAGVESGNATLDLLGGLNGRPFYVEIKRPGGSIRPMQKVVVERAKAQGYLSEIVDSLEAFKRLFDA